MYGLKGALVVAALAALPVVPVRAAGNPDAARGIVADHCSVCHQVPGFPMSGTHSKLMAPPFRTIANQPAVYPEESLRSFLRRPHYPMTKFVLSPSDIDNLIAFIESLRDK